MLAEVGILAVFCHIFGMSLGWNEEIASFEMILYL